MPVYYLGLKPQLVSVSGPASVVETPMTMLMATFTFTYISRYNISLKHANS